MSFRRVSSGTNNSTSYSTYSNTAASPTISGSPLVPHDQSNTSSTHQTPSPTMRKRQRTVDMHPPSSTPTDSHPPPPPPSSVGPATVGDDAFINDHDAADSAGDDDDDEEKPKSDKKAGRRKIKIEFIQDKSRRHITFSKRKAGMSSLSSRLEPSLLTIPIFRHYEKGNFSSRYIQHHSSYPRQAYELSTLTGTQVLLLVVSETGLVYTFTTAKLQPLVTQPEGKNLIQACLNAPHGAVPSSMPVGTPIGRSSNPLSMPGPPPTSNLPGGLAISGGSSGGGPKDEDDDNDTEDTSATHGGRASSGDKRRRRASSNAAATSSGGANRGATSPHSPNASIPPLSIPPSSQGPQSSQSHQQHQQQPPPSQISLGSPTSPQQQHQQVSASSPAQYSAGLYGHHPGQQQTQQPHHQAQHDPGLYPSHLTSPGGYSYPGGGSPAQGGPGQPLGGLANAAAQHGHWQQPNYGRR
jgi:pheromone receptor transcription factor